MEGERILNMEKEEGRCGIYFGLILRFA